MEFRNELERDFWMAAFLKALPHESDKDGSGAQFRADCAVLELRERVGWLAREESRGMGL